MIDAGMSALGLLISGPAHPVFLMKRKVENIFYRAMYIDLSHAELNLTFTREQSLYL